MWLMTNAIKTWRNESKNEVRTEGMKVSVNSAHALLMTWSNPKAPSLSSANVQSSRLHLATHSTNSQNPIWSHTHKLADLSMSRPSQPFHFVGYSRVGIHNQHAMYTKKTWKIQCDTQTDMFHSHNHTRINRHKKHLIYCVHTSELRFCFKRIHVLTRWYKLCRFSKESFSRASGVICAWLSCGWNGTRTLSG